MLLLGEGRQVLGLPLDVFDVPLGLEVLSLVRGGGEDCAFPANRALDLLLLRFGEWLRVFLLLLFLVILFQLLFLLHDIVQQLQGAELLRFQPFVFLINDDAHQDLDDDLIEFLAGLGDFPVLIGLDVVGPGELGALDLFLLELLHFQLLETGFQHLEDFLLEGDPDLHLAPGDLVPLLEEFDAVESLFLGGLVELDGEVHVLDGEFDVVGGESALGGGVHALLHDDLDDIRQDVRLLRLPLLVAHLQFSPVEDDLDDFAFGLVGEELVEVRLLGDDSVGGVLVDLLDLEDFGEVFLETVAPVDGLVAVAGDFELLGVDLVADSGHVGHLHVGRRLLQHYSFIINQSIAGVQSPHYHPKPTVSQRNICLFLKYPCRVEESRIERWTGFSALKMSSLNLMICSFG